MTFFRAERSERFRKRRTSAFRIDFLALGELGISVFCCCQKSQYSANGPGCFFHSGESASLYGRTAFCQPILGLSLSAKFAIQTFESRRTLIAGHDGANANFARIDELNVDSGLSQCPEHFFANPRVRPQADADDRELGHIFVKAQFSSGPALDN